MASSSAAYTFVGLSFSKNLQFFCPWSLYVRKYSKKHSYNLNDLIDWKKKTDLAFGNPRKLTKSGKLRKSKINENEQLQTTLEALNAQSNHFWHLNSRMNKKSVDEVSNSAIKSPVKHGASEGHIPEEFYVQPVPLHYSNDFRGKSTQIDADLLETKNSFAGVHHDKMDIYTAKSSTNFHHFLKDAPNISFRKEDQLLECFQHSSNDKTRNFAQEKNDNIHIPVISPIPSANHEVSKSYNENIKLKASNSRKSLSFKAFPSEPPASFDFINKYPLSFRHSEDEEFNDAFLKFKADVESLSLRTLPSVKSILNKTMPDLNRFFLSRWREGMIKELGEEGFKAHQDATIKRGINFHANVMELLSGKPESEIQIMPDNEGHWASLQTAMRHISGVRGLEEDIQHSFLLYRGVVDCVAKYKDVLCVIDWKTSKKPRPLLKNTYDDPLQVAAYMGSLNYNTENVNKYGDANHGLVVVIYPDGSPAHIHMMNKTLCEKYWQDWLGRLYHYYQLVYTEKFGYD